MEELLNKLIEKGCEKWKDIEWWEWLYQVSNIWRIKSLRDGRIMKLKYIQWYTNVGLNRDKKQKWYRVHRLVAQAFIPNPENKRTVNHKNWIRDDNRVENLERATYSEQERHARDVLWKITIPPDPTKYKITYNWITDTVKWWAEKLWIYWSTILQRLHRWENIEFVLSTPKERKHDTYKWKSVTRWAKELGFTQSSFNQRLQRNWYTLKEFVEWVLSGKYKKRCGNYYRN